MIIFNIELTKKNLPAIWESGGGYTKTGSAVIIADSKGDPKAPIFVRSGGHLACDKHGLFIVDKGDLIITCERNADDYTIHVYEIKSIDIDKKEAHCILLSELSMGEWSDIAVYEDYIKAINAAIEKSRCYHCRELHYRIKPQLYGDLMTLDDFISSCNDGSLIDYDGFGKYALDKTSVSKKEVVPSDVRKGNIDKTFPYVRWYNK